jgi:hypothetical protein
VAFFIPNELAYKSKPRFFHWQLAYERMLRVLCTAICYFGRASGLNFMTT